MVSGQHCEDKDRLKRRKAPEGGRKGTLMRKKARRHKLCHSVSFAAKRPHPNKQCLCRRGEGCSCFLASQPGLLGVGGGLDKQSLSGGAQSVSSTWGGGAVLCHSHLKGRATGFDSVDNLWNILVDQKSNFVKKKFLATMERRPNLQVFSFTCALSSVFETSFCLMVNKMGYLRHWQSRERAVMRAWTLKPDHLRVNPGSTAFYPVTLG